MLKSEGEEMRDKIQEEGSGVQKAFAEDSALRPAKPFISFLHAWLFVLSVLAPGLSIMSSTCIPVSTLYSHHIIFKFVFPL